MHQPDDLFGNLVNSLGSIGNAFATWSSNSASNSTTSKNHAGTHSSNHEPTHSHTPSHMASSHKKDSISHRNNIQRDKVENPTLEHTIKSLENENIFIDKKFRKLKAKIEQIYKSLSDPKKVHIHSEEPEFIKLQEIENKLKEYKGLFTSHKIGYVVYDKVECVSCMEKGVDTICLPCGHMCLHEHCAKTWFEKHKNQTCPMCRNTVTEYRKVYVPK